MVMHICNICGKKGKNHKHPNKGIDGMPLGVDAPGVGEANYLKHNYLDPNNKNMRKFFQG